MRASGGDGVSLDRDIALLSRVRFFEGFGAEEIRLIAFGVEPRELADGERLLREGSYSDGAFVVREGAVALTSRRSRDAPVLGPADIVSPLALVSEIDHGHTVTARGPAEVVKVSRQLFRRVLEEYPHLAALLERRVRASLAGMGPELERILRELGD